MRTGRVCRCGKPVPDDAPSGRSRCYGCSPRQRRGDKEATVASRYPPKGPAQAREWVARVGRARGVELSYFLVVDDAKPPLVALWDGDGDGLLYARIAPKALRSVNGDSHAKRRVRMPASVGGVPVLDRRPLADRGWI